LKPLWIIFADHMVNMSATKKLNYVLHEAGFAMEQVCYINGSK